MKDFEIYAVLQKHGVASNDRRLIEAVREIINAVKPDKSQDAKAVADVMEYEGVIYAELREPINLTAGTLLYTTPPPTEPDDAARLDFVARYGASVRLAGDGRRTLLVWGASDPSSEGTSLLDNLRHAIDAALQAAAKKEGSQP